MKNINFIEAVTERDIDILFLEELMVSVEFQKWFINKVCALDLYECHGVWHSISEGGLGESDLIFVFTVINGTKYGLLVENKIDAPAQGEQAERYVRRGELGIEKKYWEEFFTCITAPATYLETNAEAEKYQKQISYEEIYEYFNLKVDNRSAFKANMIAEAIEQNRRGYTFTPDERVTEFWNKYFKYVQAHFSEFEMNEPGIKPADSDFVYFQPNVLEKRMNIVHKLARGAVDLQIFGMGNKLDELSEKLNDYINDEVELVKTNKSGSLRITVPVLERSGSFEEQLEMVKDGLAAAKKLLSIGMQIKKKI